MTVSGHLVTCQSQCPDDITELRAGVTDGVKLLCDNLDADSGEPGECECLLPSTELSIIKVLIVNVNSTKYTASCTIETIAVFSTEKFSREI